MWCSSAAVRSTARTRGGGVKISDPSDRFERDAVANADRLMSTPGSCGGTVS